MYYDYGIEPVHEFCAGPDGKCLSGWQNKHGQWVTCGLERWSVLHNDLESEFREMHWHGGGDCMCFEDDLGPSYHEAMEEYVRTNGYRR